MLIAAQLTTVATRAQTNHSASLHLYVQGNNNSISGHVSDHQRAPVPNIRIELLNEVDTVIQTVKTDGSGLFIFRKLSDGTFQVRVQTAGTNYVSQTKRVDLSRPHGFGASFEEIEFALTTNRKSTTASKPGVVFAQEVPAPARQMFDRATDLLAKDKHDDAMTALKNAVEIYPQYFDALDLLGNEQVKYGQYEQAVPVLTKALEVNPRGYQSAFALGVAHFKLKQVSPAIEALRRAVMLNEKSVNANLWLGITLRQTSKLDEAETYLRRADVLSESKLPEAHWQLALLLNQLKRYKEAADQLEVFLKLQPDSRDADLIKKLIAKLRDQAKG
jgi:Flp pilus assembly protein TadD